MNHLVRPAVVALLAAALAGCGLLGGEGAAADRVDAKTGCPEAELLEPVLGSPAFTLKGHGAHEGTGRYCRYEPAGANPNGTRLEVYYKPVASPGGLTPATGYGALPEFGPEAYFPTSCPDDPGTGRLGAHFSTEKERHNTQELVFHSSGTLARDCAAQLRTVRSLVKIFYNHQIIVPGTSG